MSDVMPCAAGSTAASYLDMSAGRLGASLGALVALAGVVVGVRALRQRQRGGAGGVLALTAGLVAAALGVAVVATADGGPGSGEGWAGGVVAVVLGLTSTALGVLAVRRTRGTPGVTAGAAGEDPTRPRRDAHGQHLE